MSDVVWVVEQPCGPRQWNRWSLCALAWDRAAAEETAATIEGARVRDWLIHGQSSPEPATDRSLEEQVGADADAGERMGSGLERMKGFRWRVAGKSLWIPLDELVAVAVAVSSLVARAGAVTGADLQRLEDRMADLLRGGDPAAIAEARERVFAGALDRLFAMNSQELGHAAVEGAGTTGSDPAVPSGKRRMNVLQPLSAEDRARVFEADHREAIRCLGWLAAIVDAEIPIEVLNEHPTIREALDHAEAYCMDALESPSWDRVVGGLLEEAGGWWPTTTEQVAQLFSARWRRIHERVRAARAADETERGQVLREIKESFARARTTPGEEEA